jgi:pimeloyl-ACP methyl ester carboxylesterase
MKFVLIGLIALAAGSQASLLFSSPVDEYAEKFNWQPTASRDVKEVREAIFTQWVDHFNDEDGTTFDQTVYINDQYYLPGGPVLVLISAISDAYTYWLENSHMVNIANQLGGVIYALEPRYFGKSMPTQDLSLANLESYLQINQTLSDNVNFITFLRQQLVAFGSDKFVLVGHGRGGTLATWLHQRYPNLADGLWAVSAPIYTLYDFGLYYYGMAGTFAENFPATCQQVITEGFSELEELVDDENIERIREIFILDENNDFDLSNEHDVALFYNQLFETLFTPVEYGVPGTIDVICTHLVPSDGFSSLELLSRYYGYSLYNRVFQYDLLVSNLQQETLDVQQAHDRQNLYIACAGWSQFKTSNQLPDPVNTRFPSSLFADLCGDVFGIVYSDLYALNDQTNADNTVSSDLPNSYFTNAEFDPHRIIGVSHDLNPTSPHVLIPGVGKLYDFFLNIYPDYYSEELQAARDLATQLITLWTRSSV